VAMDERIELPCAVLPPESKGEACRVLGIDAKALEAIIDGTMGFLPDVGLVDEKTAEDRGVEFGDCTGVDGIAPVIPKLVRKHVEIEKERLAEVRGARIRIVDDLHGASMAVDALSDVLRRLIELRAPEIILRHQRGRLQRCFEELALARAGKPRGTIWKPYEALMPGPPVSLLCEAPLAIYAMRDPADVAEPRDCFVLPTGFLVQFPYASVVIAPSGKVGDFFPTCGLRAVGCTDDLKILFVSGGGRAADTGYFTPTPIVRDVIRQKWVTGKLPKGLPRYVAGTVADVKCAIVADLHRALGYHVSPDWFGDQCGCTTTSLDGAYAFDGGWFMIEAATGKRILDMRQLEYGVLSFTRRADGAWRFVATKEETGARVIDESGEVIAKPRHPVCAIDRAGERILSVSKKELVYETIGGNKPIARVDLAPLARKLAMPEDTDLWHLLLATFGVAERVPKTPKRVRAAFEAGYVTIDDGLTDAEIERAIFAAQKHPKLGAV
jgi:hypothetical protein